MCLMLIKLKTGMLKKKQRLLVLRIRPDLQKARVKSSQIFMAN